MVSEGMRLGGMRQISGGQHILVFPWRLRRSLTNSQVLEKNKNENTLLGIINTIWYTKTILTQCTKNTRDGHFKWLQCLSSCLKELQSTWVWKKEKKKKTEAASIQIHAHSFALREVKQRELSFQTVVVICFKLWSAGAKNNVKFTKNFIRVAICIQLCVHLCPH